MRDKSFSHGRLEKQGFNLSFDDQCAFMSWRQLFFSKLDPRHPLLLSGVKYFLVMKMREKLVPTLRFSNAFTRMVTRSFSTMSFSILIEGKAIEQFASGHGLKQGTPLSLILFNLMLENLSQNLHIGKIERASTPM